MKGAYNIALTPCSKGERITELSKRLSSMADRYVLGEKSLPHVTLYRFDLENEHLNEVWKTVCSSIKQKQLLLEFDLRNPSLITFDNDILWASLLPNNPNILIGLHRTIAQTLKLPIDVNFDPHLTLINTKTRDYGDFVLAETKRCGTITDMFVLSIGESDEIGQFTKTLYTEVIEETKKD